MPSRRGDAAENAVALSSSTSEGGGGRDGDPHKAGAGKVSRGGGGKKGKEMSKGKEKKRKENEASLPSSRTVGGRSKEKVKENHKEASSASNTPRSVTATCGGGGGECQFPMSRVWRLVRSMGDNGAGGDVRTTNEAVFLINKATEIFLETIAEEAHSNIAAGKKRKDLSYENLSSIVHDVKKYEFLSDFVPHKVRAEDALRAKASME